MADYTHNEAQLRQRLTSTFFNESLGWIARLVPEALRRLFLADVEETSGVISGLQVSVIDATMQVAVSGGLGLYWDDSVENPDSKHRWIEVTDGAPIIVELDPGDATPRWDVIEIAPGVVDGPGQDLDIYDKNSGAFQSVTLSPLKLGTPTVTVRKGTPNAFPKLIAGTDGVMPLAYVYVAANAVVLTATRVLHCRPLLTPRRGVYRNEDKASILSPYFEQRVSGGGFRIDANGLDGFLTMGMSGTFPNGGLSFSLPANTNISLSSIGNYAGGGLPGANQLIYMYVAPPSYPAGYASHLAPRELFISDTTTPGINATIPSGARNCIVVGSGTAPALTPNGQPGGPNATTSFVDAGIFGNYSVRRSDMLYLGAAFYDIIEFGFIAQKVSGWTVSPSRHPGANPFPDFPIVAQHDYFMRAHITGDSAISWPATAVDCRVQVRAACDDAGNLTLGLEDYFAQSGNVAALDAVFPNNSGGQQNVGTVVPVTLDASGQLKVRFASGTGLASCRFYGVCYDDAVLRLR